MATAIGIGQIEVGAERERNMNTVNGLTKVMVCGAASVALTLASSWVIVESTAHAYWHEDMATVVILAKAEHAVANVRVSQSTTAGLLQ